MSRLLHIKSLLLVNIILTTGILLSRSLCVSVVVFLSSLIALLIFYDTQKLVTLFKLVYKLKYLFITLVIFQLLLRRQGSPIYRLLFINYSLYITSDGIFYAFNSLLRYFVILSSAIMLSGASPYEMIKALRTWHLPESINIIVSFTILFLKQLQTDFRILSQNLKKRNINLSLYTRLSAMKSHLNIISNLIIPIIGRLFSDIQYKVIAMELNGVSTAHKVIPFKYRKCRPIDYLLICTFLLWIIGLLYYGNHY